ncbi:multi-sensor signal transduction histidine kinase [Stanieria cyanosphaera PCC 7437]|uniref:histidine kinase n=1 Tax=Stanieria cyanosphaera (strain ATCC 29371 / PCC 7437) TaxID=111780 RepID=K9XV46_STAC7|nr:PAS domain-containing sensor histidine kinase [Stanieria cyanosphaera]AFZ35537.1 multi-sensor signal transduction histidine kinase [Stanieria cyanosphaera PCC 7437]
MTNHASSPLQSSSRQNFASQLKFAAIVTSLLVICLGCAGILGWVFDLTIFKSIFPQHVTMKVSTALGFILGGILLLLWHQQQSHSRNNHALILCLWQYLLPSLIILFSLLTLGEYGFNLDLSTDWLAFPEPDNPTDLITRGRMTPYTALNFFLFNLAFLLLIQKYYLTAQLLIVLVIAIATVNLVGHTYNITIFYEVVSGTEMAIHTAFGFILLAFAFLGSCPERGWIKEIATEKAGGLMARWLFPILLLIPPFSGWFFWWWLQGNVYSVRLIIALRILLEMVFFGVIVWWSAKKLNEMDRQRQQVSQALLDTEKRFRAIFNQTFQFIGLLAPDGTLLEANQTILDFGGISLSEVVGKPFWQTYWWQISEQTQLDLQSAIALARQGEFIRYEVDLQGANKRIITIDFSLRPVIDEIGAVILLIPEGRDISERKQAEKALQKSELRYRAIVEDQTELICRYLPDSTMLFANDAYCRYFGLDKNTLINQKYTPVIYETDRQRVDQLVESMNIDHPSVMIENRVWAKGKVRWTQWNNRMIFDRQGQFLEYQSVGRDITELKEVEENLRATEELFRQLAENIKDIFFLYSADGKLIYVSPAYEKILHQSCSSLYENPESWLAMVHPNDRPIFQQALAQLNQGDQTYEYRVIAPDGEEASPREGSSLPSNGRACELRQINWIRTRTFVIQDESGKVYRIAGIGEDVTIQKQAEEKFNALIQELKRSNEALEEFAYVVSHDLLSPLHKQRMLRELLLAQYGEILDEQAQEYLDSMAQLNQKMQNLVRGLLAFARVTTQAQPFVLVDLNSVVREVIEEFEAEIAQVNAQIEVGTLPTINGDRLQLYQLFHNLLENALKFRAVERQLKIKIYQLFTTQTPLDTQMCQIMIEDNGIGFETEAREKIFAPFHRLQSYRKYKGTGLGLAICRKIIERHQGTITAQSQLQQGASFTICLPF